MYCPHCYETDDEEDESFYPRNCAFCGKVIPPTRPLPIVYENDIKLKVLQANVREIIRKQLEKQYGNQRRQ